MRVLFLAVSGPTLMKFRDDIGDPPQFLITYHILRRRYWPSKLPLSCEVVENRYILGSEILLGSIPKKSLRSLLLLTDTRHALKFCKDPFRGVDRLDSPLTKSSKIGFWAPNVCGGRGPKSVYGSLVWFCWLNCEVKIKAKLLLSTNRKASPPQNTVGLETIGIRVNSEVNTRRLAQQWMTLGDLEWLKSTSSALRAISALAELLVISR